MEEELPLRDILCFKRFADGANILTLASDLSSFVI